MARIRTIKPSFFRSRAVRRLSSSDVKLVWVGLWPFADDEGRLVDEPGLLTGDLWALDLTEEQIESALTELHDKGRIVRYEANGERFIQVTNWLDHQKISKSYPSDIPPSPFPEHSGNATGALPLGREGKGIGREGNVPSPLSPFCPKHPEGTDTPCRACGRARVAHQIAAEAKKNKPTVPGIVTDPDCPKHPGRPLRGCDRCAEEAVA